ncbi:zonular occludens toxin domain-containing protein [Aquabacterium sp. CECT 9606]|uniref:zonular occludens toxin domain-containing protein n=1 Tax=Aquabacterium sp. CECT 9606 TaxID=2845822 RepID=UPI001E3F513A|nr:zonular occludens toxin domain-containing protein [Aquabacterium sp. CECT 9606]CAH0354788.1 hypothetical protein AQB9606_03941 [Aquabacterium sp. CECT 9606]
MIVLITGVPGSGKTLFTIDELRKLAEKDQRQVYYSGITDIKLPWIEHDARDWMSLPPNSIMVIDEAQRFFRPRANGATVPPEIAAMETHRHLGVDIYLITQHPMLIDQNIRRLTGRHFHLHRMFGMHAATVHEYPKVKENCDKHSADALKRTWKYPKDVFSLYKSAEVHTHKVRIPRQAWYLLGLILVFALGATYLYKSRVSPKKEQQASASDSFNVSGISSPGPGSYQRKALTPAEYVQQFQPRVAGLAYTAPVYDEVTKPVRAPYPAACVQGKSRCQCYTQQGTKLETDKALCEGIVAGGFFMAWDENKGQERVQVNKPPVMAPVATREPSSGLINATPGWTPSSARPLAEQIADGQNLRHGKNNRIPG